MFKKSLIAASILAAATVAQAAPLSFDPDGTGAGSSYLVDQLDWLPSSVLAQGGNQAIANYLNGGSGTDLEFTVLSHFRLGAGLLGGSTVFSTGGGYEITAVIGFTEKVTYAAAPGTNPLAPLGAAAFDYVNDGNSFVNIYFHGAPNANQLQGTGFNDGQLIFSSTISSANGSYSNTGLTPELLDDTPNGDDWNGQLTLPGQGINSNFLIDVAAPTFIDSNFFTNLPLLQFVITNISLNNPFVATDPSYAFVDKDGNPVVVTADAGVTTTLGPVNGQLFIDPTSGRISPSGPDFIFSSDVNSSVSATAIPEPGALALSGLALGLLGLAGRRKRA